MMVWTGTMQTLRHYTTDTGPESTMLPADTPRSYSATLSGHTGDKLSHLAVILKFRDSLDFGVLYSSLFLLNLAISDRIKII